MNMWSNIHSAPQSRRPHFDNIFRRGECAVHRRNRDVCPCREELGCPRKEAEIRIKSIIARLKVRADFIGDRFGIMVIGVQMWGSCISVNEEIHYILLGNFRQLFLHGKHRSAHRFHEHRRVKDSALLPAIITPWARMEGSIGIRTSNIFPSTKASNACVSRAIFR